MDMIRIGDVCEVLNGFAFKSENYVDTGIRVIRIANVQKGYIEDNTPAFYPLDSDGIDRFMLDEGDLLMSLTGNVGRVAILAKEFLPAALNQRVACLRMKSDKISKRYLFHILNSDFFEKQCIQSSKGVAQKNMSTEWLKEYEIPLYSHTEQKEIIDVLDSILAIIEERKLQIRTLDQLIKARFVEMFGDNKYPTKTVKDVLNDSFWLMPATPKYIEEGIPYITSKNIKNRILDFGDTKFISEEDYLRISRNRPVRPGDILISMIGTLGQTAIAPKGKSFYGQNVYLLRLNNEIINTSFFCEFFNSGDVQNKLAGKSNQSTQAYLKANHVEDLPIPLAPMEIQNKFASFVAQVDKSKVVVQEALDKAQILFDSLKQQYFG